MQFEDIDGDANERKLLQLPLLWVCHNFRAVVLARFCSHRHLDISDFKNEEERVAFASHSWPDSHWDLGFPGHNLAKELDIDLDLWSIFTGQALQLLSSAPYNGCSFPLVRKISINMDIQEEDGDENSPAAGGKHKICLPPDTTANIAAFVLRLKEMAPSVSELIATPAYAVEELLERLDPHMMDMAQRLSNFVEPLTTITYASHLLVGHIELEPISNLVHISYSIVGHHDALLPLTRRSAQTLQTLDLDMVNMPDMTGLIQDPNGGGYVEYSCLQQLKIYMRGDSVASRELVFRGAVPFPSLRRLYIDRGCPFNDDVLFRGNNSTLESFITTLSSATVAMLKKYNVFTPTSHPKLQYVSIKSLYRQPSRPFDTTAAYMEFVLSIAPGASVRAISNLSEFGGALRPAFELFGKHTSIQVLYMTDTPLSFWDITEIISDLPLLSDLYTTVPLLRGHPQSIDMAELPEYMRSTYAPMNQRFRCWYFASICGVSLQDLATYVLLLALVCPNFDYAAVGSYSGKLFMEAMKEKIAEPGFSKYASRLQRLLFDGYERF
ncbi:hypothetical protein IWW47_000703 [Coemansia sp. RSA 2052]|nr:hypothetical protein IWW47_000703 [Coemansia sp. RSA 2052]